MRVSLEWWLHYMKMLSALLAVCEGNRPITDGFPSQRANGAGLSCFLSFDGLTTQLTAGQKHSRGRWIEMPWRLSDIAVIAGIKHCLTSPTARLFVPKLTQANKKEKSMFCIIALRVGTPSVYVPQMANHYSDVIMGAMAMARLKSSTSPLFTQPCINIKAPRHWPLCGEFTGQRWIPRTNGL